MIVSTQTTDDGRAVTFTDEQKRLTHGWMAAARAEGLSDAVTAIIGTAAEIYFDCNGAYMRDAAHLTDIIMSALSKAEKREAEAESQEREAEAVAGEVRP
jgi:hypothetical protein